MKRKQIWLNDGQKEILKDATVFVLKAALVGTAFAVAMTSPYFLNNVLRAYLKSKKGMMSEKDLKKVASKIYKDRLVEIIEKNRKQYLKITNKGRKQLVEFNIDTVEIKKQKWDGCFRLVMFDIPEIQQIARRALRDKLKEIGFIKIQKSVWASPYECKNEIDFITTVYGVERFVNYAVVKEIDNAVYLRSVFNLV